MPFDKFKSAEELWKERREGVQASLQPVSLDELKAIVRQHEEEFVGDPWRDEFLRLMQEQPHASFFRAMPQDDVVVFYCQDADFGVWIAHGTGSGPLDETGKRVMKEAIQGPISGRKSGGKK